MKYLKYFESNSDNFEIEKEEIKEIFSDFIDDFQIRVTFGKRLRSTDEVNLDDFLKLKSIPVINVRLNSKMRLGSNSLTRYIKSNDFKIILSEIISKLDYNELEINKFEVEENSIIFLIYKKMDSL